MSRLHLNKPGGAQHGFTLLEILITVIVVAIGLLGLAGLQVTSLRYNHQAYLRGQVTMQAADIVDRMRANMAGADSYLFDDARKSFAQLGTAKANCEKLDSCTAQDMALNDLYRWNQTNRANLPGGAGIVCRDSTPQDGVFDVAGDKVSSSGCDNADNAWVVKIWWIEDERRANADTSTPNVRFYATSLGTLGN